MADVLEIARIVCDEFTISVLATDTTKYGDKGIEILDGPEGDYIVLVPRMVATTWTLEAKIATLTILERMCREVYARTN